MKNLNPIVIFLFIFQNLCAQHNPRTVLKGQLFSDNKPVQDIKIVNKSENKFALSTDDGIFYISAKPKDTLVFSGFSIETLQLILKDSDFKLNIFKVNLTAFANNLDEIELSKKRLTGILSIDEKNIKITEIAPIDVGLALNSDYEKDKFSTLENKLIPGYLDTTYMTNFVAIASMLAEMISPKKEKKKTNFTTEKIFHDYVKEQFSENFFIDRLKLKKDEIGLFLAFCENDSNATKLIGLNKRLELIEFLYQKQKEFSVLSKE